MNDARRAAKLSGPWSLDVEPDDAAAPEMAVPPAEPPPLFPRAVAQDEPPPPPPERIIEALLFAGGEALTAERARQLVRGLTADQFDAALRDLNQCYRRQHRPYLVRVGPAGAVLTVRHPHGALRARLETTPRAVRLSQPAIDVLALVAYTQPITRGEIESRRGAESVGVLRLLSRLGLVAADADGRYATTARFLELQGLDSLADLPRVGT